MEISESDQKLINEGAVHYFDPLRALREFRILILGLCDDVVQRRGEDLAKAMGTQVDISTASGGVWPDKHGDLLNQASWKRASIWRSLYFPDFGRAYWVSSAFLRVLVGTRQSPCTPSWATRLITPPSYSGRCGDSRRPASQE